MEPGTTWTGIPARSRRLDSSVPMKPSAAASSKALRHKMDERSLRGLRVDDELAGDGGGDDGAVRSALYLLDGVDGGPADNGGTMFRDGVNGALDGGRVD